MNYAVVSRCEPPRRAPSWSARCSILSCFLRWRPVFGHGQLYVAASRTGNDESIVLAIKSEKDMEPFTTRNVVFKEILEDYMVEGWQVIHQCRNDFVSVL